ncbi:hypothetical protein ACLOJK_033592 [Asimina triloba]
MQASPMRSSPFSCRIDGGTNAADQRRSPMLSWRVTVTAKQLLTRIRQFEKRPNAMKILAAERGDERSRSSRVSRQHWNISAAAAAAAASSMGGENERGGKRLRGRGMLRGIRSF